MIPLCCKKQETCDLSQLKLHRCETSRRPQPLFFSGHAPGYREPEIELWLMGEPENLKMPHPATLWERQDLPVPTRQTGMMAKPARKVWEMPEGSPACADTADREEAAE